MKGAAPFKTRKLSKRNISQRISQANQRHKERMKKARFSKSPVPQQEKYPLRNSNYKKALYNNLNLNKSCNDISSPPKSNPTNPSTPQFHSSKVDSSFILSTSLKSISKYIMNNVK